MKLIVTPEALADLREIEEHIGKDNPAEAVEFVTRLTERFSQLVLFPNSGRKRDVIRPGYRSVVEGDYVIIYKIMERDLLAVLRVIHGKRDLGKIVVPGSETL